MLARVIEFSATSDAAAEFTRVVEETVLRIVNAHAGCVAGSVQVRGQAVMGLSIWTSAAAESYSLQCYQDIEKMLRPFLKCDPKVYALESREIETPALRAIRPPGNVSYKNSPQPNKAPNLAG